MNQEPQAASSSSSFINQSIQNVTDAFGEAKKSVTDAMSGFSNQPNAPSEFSFSNTIVAKFAFLLLIIIFFIYAINLGVSLISYFISPQNNPFLIKGMSSGSSPLTIYQNPGTSGSVPLMRSNNESHGAEFTWSVWLYIDDLPTNNMKYRNIFNKGDNNYSKTTGLSTVNNAPGLYLGNGGDASKPINTLHVMMDVVGDAKKMPATTSSTSVTPGGSSGTSSVLGNPGAVGTGGGSSVSSTSTATKNGSFMMNKPAIVDVPNVPLKKWFHVAIRLENSVLDVYINGTIDQRAVLTNVPKQNYNDVNVCQNGGFTGNLSDLRYFNSALNVFQITTIVEKGPNMSTSSQTIQSKELNNYNYLSSFWYNPN
jgi:hypothetical protein